MSSSPLVLALRAMRLVPPNRHRRVAAQPAQLRLHARRHGARLVGACLALSLVACAGAPPVARQSLLMPAGPAGVSAAQTASHIQVVGSTGRALGLRSREQVVKTLAAEGNPADLKRQLRAMSLNGPVELLTGNRARLLIDGPMAFDAMFAALESAKRSIWLESYIIEDTQIAQRLAELLVRKRQQGVAVAVIYDAVGSIGTNTGFFDSLRAQGIGTCAFNPLNPVQRPGYWSISHRDHRKILVVDGHTAFTGGINISSVYASGSFGRSRRSTGPSNTGNGWRDTQVQLNGSAARALHALVRQTWQQQGCKGAMPPEPLEPIAVAGDDVLRVVPASPDQPDNPIYTTLLTAIDASQRSVHLTMAYFAPGQDMVDALADAARRGVDVQLILPSASDFAPVLHAGRSYYSELLDAGVKLYELQSAILHAKTMVVDGVMATVGSSNMDWRSFAANNEINVVVLGKDFGDAMLAMFKRDLADSKRIDPATWAERPVSAKAKEQLARWFEGLW